MKTKEDIAKSHQQQMCSVESLEIRQTIEDALNEYELQLVKNNVVSANVRLSLPDWYKKLSLLNLQMKALQEDIPRYLKERSGNIKDLECFDIKLTAMRSRLDRTIKELKGNEA